MSDVVELDRPQASVASLKAKELPLVRLMAGFALLDGELSPKEAAAIQSVCKEFNLDFSLVKKQLEALQKSDCAQICEAELQHFVSEAERELVLMILFEIADADDI